MTMQLSYLAQGEKTKETISGKNLPEGIALDSVEKYDAKGGQLYFITFSTKSDTLSSARALSRLRDSLPAKKHVRILRDDASAKFAKALYPKLADYERALRRVLTLSMCAEHDNFEDKLVKNLDESTLSELGSKLFYSDVFKEEVFDLVNSKGPISKSDFLARIEGIEERTVWNDLFGDGELKGVRENFRAINKIRNKVMHHRTISAKEYDEAKELLAESTGELETYANHIHEDPSYQKRHSANALSAARLLGGNYASEVAGAQVFLDKIAPLLSSQSFADYYALSDSVSAAAKVLSQSVATIDPSRLSAVSSLAEALSESITKIQGPALQAAISQLTQNAIPSGLTTSLLASAALAREQSNPLEDDDEEKGQGESHDRDSSESEESSEEERKEGFD